MLILNNLSVSVQWKQVLNKVSMQFSPWKNYAIIGPNGSGKSSLAMTIMGNPKYSVQSGECRVQSGKTSIDLLKLAPHERAKLWVFLAFQHIPEIKWVKVFEFLRSVYDAKNGTTTSFLQFKKIVEPLLAEIKLDKDFLRREVNVGFSGGERRKLEILQLKLLQPTYIFLDEIDSGLDVDAFKSVVKMIAKFNHENNTFIIITHIFDILKYIPIDHVYVLEQGKIIKEGDQKLIEVIKKEGFTTLS